MIRLTFRDYLRIAWLTAGANIERVLRPLAAAPIRIGLSVGCTAFIVGGTVFSLVEKDASFIDGLYWATVVMPTVGFGDYSPHTLLGRLDYIAVVACGWFATLMIGGALAGAVAQQRIEHHASTPELDDDIDHLAGVLNDGLARLKAITSHPRVRAALREAHNDQDQGGTP